MQKKVSVFSSVCVAVSQSQVFNQENLDLKVALIGIISFERKRKEHFQDYIMIRFWLNLTFWGKEVQHECCI